MYKKVDTDMSFAAREKEVAEFWKDNDIIKKSFHLRDGAKESFTFFDGPPTANGKPHIGHVLTRTMKDLFPRYQTMKGKSVLRKAGWDTHGLPVELEVEKKLGLDGKPQIEKYGIEPFIKECKESVWKYLHEWEEMSERVGYWVDMENPYVTYHDDYIESEWWSLKQIYEKGLLYKGHKVVPFCPRCGTALSSHEVAQGYKAVKEYSAFVKFRVKNADTLTYILAWTTTPWTLPSNVALCVNAKEDYIEFELYGVHNIMAKALVSAVFSEEDIAEMKTVREMKGADLVGTEYEPLFPLAELPREKAWYVVSDDYVTLTDGTGVVHIAPAFGEDDARVGRVNKLPFVQLVNTQGRFVEGTPWEGMFVKETDEPIMSDLKARGLLLKKALYEHEYPFCWRCDTPLIYYARPTWFIRMTELRDRLTKNNRSINWFPDNIKEGRMGNFLENVVDWGLSRERYWGTPLPVWQCEEGHIHVVGSKQELYDMAIGEVDLPELHRPYIDKVKLRCPECGKEMTRVKEVIDCWYDSGSMPFAQWHYPFENKEMFEKNFPADFISEAIDQTRGWFYTLIAIGTLIFDKAPFENCLVLGHVQDKDGRKMSKHLGNVVDPWSVLDVQGADAVRWYFYTAGAPWIPSRFYPEAVSEQQPKFMGTLWNTYAFFILYANIDSFNIKEHPIEQVNLSLMDKWVLSKLNTLIKTVDSGLESYKVPETARAIAEFTDELSNWYVRRSRERFWGKGMAGDKEAAFSTLYTVLSTLSRVIAPFLPFLSEELYQNLVRSVDKDAPESVHLTSFPVCEQKYIDADMEKQMDALIEVAQLGRACRNLASMKVRQPSKALYVKGARFDEKYAELVEDELNVKSVVFTDDAREFTTYHLKPQMRTLGPKYGKLLGKIGARLGEMDGNEVVEAFDRGETLHFDVDGTEVCLEKNDVLTEPMQKEGFVAQTDASVTVVLDTNLTPELIREGYAREVVSKLQTMRKEAGFDVSDRINVWYTAGAEVSGAVEALKDTITSGVLALSMTAGEPDEGAVVKEWDINGKPATLCVKQVK
ncbi:MAG: isoleucine--tRNA ligase [Eubacteriales bacterium]|nr:isoleucine--tRNA ligase [Eubacteriales bacterium]MDD4511782.1 isoleucine--tRNA ligase [Eubacteriales bacterium]